MPHSDLRGVIAAAATPVTADFSIDVDRLAAHCARLLADGCAFVSSFGTTGEGASFSTAEKIAALRALKAAGASMAHQIPSIMTPSTDEAGGMLAEIAALGCRAALVLPPFYYPVTEEGIVAFFALMLERAGNPDIELLLYNIPQLSRTAFTPSLIDKLVARFGSRIVGLKDSTGDVENGVMLARRYPGLSIFTGDDRVVPALLAAGGAGMIGGMPNVFARDLRALYDAPEGPAGAALLANQAARIDTVNANGSQLALKAALAEVYADPEWARAMPPLVALGETEARGVWDAFLATGFVYGDAAA
ncbi:dihydrodipicolinate synthase family protein [Arsenicitalea aurantiaca]|uniref:dihydrodipicolinate synthase family protein n=1 Tax=Arsenicitalea aurantiaca TaxID=1783274 RepID=UPI001315905D|nr:dihydrodipicolinate synthase family protein [Arsenicitalea aurantiaca]